MKWNDWDIPGIDIDATCKRISQLINESGLTDKSLGRMMGLSVQSINKWRHGHNLPDIENLYRLGWILGKKLDDILIPRWQVQYETKIEMMVERMSAKAKTEEERRSVSTIRRLWAYYKRLGDKMLLRRVNDSIA